MAAPKKKKLTAAEAEAVRKQIADLETSLEDVEEAAPAEEEEAEAELERQRAATAALFDKLGLTEDDYNVLAAAMAAGTEDATRRIVREELAREEEEEGSEPEPKPDPESGKGGTLAELEENPGAPEVPKDEPPQTPPASRHWTERRFGPFTREEEG